jgi:hypothetical protein
LYRDSPAAPLRPWSHRIHRTRTIDWIRAHLHELRRVRVAVPLALAIVGIVAAVIMAPGGTKTLGPPGLFPSPSAPDFGPPPPTTGTKPGLPVPSPTGSGTSSNDGTNTSTPPRPVLFGVNLLGGDQGTFDSGTGGWSASAPARLGRVGAPVARGSGALAVRNSGTNAAMLTAASGNGPATWTLAAAGTRWVGHVSTRAGDSGVYVGVIVRFLNTSGQRIAQAGAQRTVDRSTSYQQTWDAVGLAPPGTAYVALLVTFQRVAAGSLHYIDNASLMALRGGSPNVVGPLHTAGTRIVDARGRTVILRGFTRAGLEGADAPPASDDDIAHAKAWGANFIRLPLGEQFWLSTSCYYRASFVHQVDEAVRMVTSRGMVALLVLHWNTIKPCGRYGQQPMADYPNAITFWQQVASRYKHNPLVAFDLYNEPHHVSDAQWRNGGTMTWKGDTFRAAGMQQMYDAVRRTGATNLIFASGKSWANIWPKTAPLTGNNIVYAVHVYTCPVTPPPDCDNTAPYDPAQFFQFWTSPGRKYPVVVSEFGWPDPSNAAFNRNVIAYAEQHGWGWAAYTWGSVTWGRFSLLADAGPGRSYQPQPAGSVILAAFPGV